MKKIMLTSATVLFLGLAAMAHNGDKCGKKCDKKECKKECVAQDKSKENCDKSKCNHQGACGTEQQSCHKAQKPKQATPAAAPAPAPIKQ